MATKAIEKENMQDQRKIKIATVTLQKFCTTHKILYLPQVLGSRYHINMIIYKYSIYIFDMNMRSGSHALLHVEKSEKMRF